jgi:hypothetical protein
MRQWRSRVTGSAPFAERLLRVAERRARPARSVATQIELILSGLNPKAQLLLLCARIGYTPHASFQH